MPNIAPKILVIKEKHDESTYLIESVDDFARVRSEERRVGKECPV